MSRFPKSARRPDFSSLVDKWGAVRNSINLVDESNLSDFPQLATIGSDVSVQRDLEYFEAASEVVGAHAIRALAKGYEALDASSTCGKSGVVMGAIVHAYNASYFAARAFCMLMGFAPLDRDSVFTLDVFSEETGTSRKIVRSSGVLRLYRYKRWGHAEVWALTKRLVDTMDVPITLSGSREMLRTAKVGQGSKIRNAFQYDDSQLSATKMRGIADFPRRVLINAWDDSVPNEIRANFLIAKNLMNICDLVIKEGRIDHLLFSCIAQDRVDSMAVWGKWAT